MRQILKKLLPGLLLTASTLSADEPVQPEAGFGNADNTMTTASRFMIAAANPLASEAGYEVLANGGTAMDAAIAAQLVLNLVEPQSSGIGGGAFMLYYNAENQSLTTLDGRETAPAAAQADQFIGEDGNPLPWWQRITGGQAVGVPGTLKLLAEGHARFGSAEWSSLFKPAIDLAEEGFKVSPRMSASINGAKDRGLQQFETTRDYFFTADGEPLPEGYLLKNPEFAQTLRLIARQGEQVFYRGEIGKALVETVNANRPGSMDRDDLNAYRVVERPAVCGAYRRYRVCGMGPPSSGGMTVAQILGILNNLELPGNGFNTETVHLIGEAQKLAYADRGRYMADSDFVEVPISALLDPAYLAARAALIQPGQPMPKAEAGIPDGVKIALADHTGTELAGTSHISIVDSYGNVLSMTTTIESGFGSRLMSGGFLLNNELTDFSAHAERDGIAIANRIEPGKRPRSSMAPTIVFDAAGNPVLTLGSPGGSRIINYVVKTLIAMIDLEMDIQSAINTAHFSNRNGVTDLEAERGLDSVAAALEEMGQGTKLRDLNSGLHGIHIDAGGHLFGGADPRREGVARGD